MLINKRKVLWFIFLASFYFVANFFIFYALEGGVNKKFVIWTAISSLLLAAGNMYFPVWYERYRAEKQA